MNGPFRNTGDKLEYRVAQKSKPPPSDQKSY